MVAANPSSVGLVNWFDTFRKVRDARESLPQGSTRSAVDAARYLTIYDQSGKQINLMEQMRSDLPSVWTRSDLLLANLRRVRDLATGGLEYFQTQYAAPEFEGIKLSPADEALLTTEPAGFAEMVSGTTGPYKPKKP